MIKKKNITVYTPNNLLLYLIYLHKGFVFVITIIAVRLDYSRGTACAAYTGYHVRVTRVGQSTPALVPVTKSVGDCLVCAMAA